MAIQILLSLALLVLLGYLDSRSFGLVAGLWASVSGRRRIASLRREVQRNTADVRHLVALGEELLEQEKAAEAAVVLEDAARKGETGARATYLLGAALIRLGRHAEGRTKIEEAVERAPDIGFGEPYLYLLEEAFTTGDAQAPRVMQLVHGLDRYDSVALKTRAGRLCTSNGRRDLGARLLEDALQNYTYIPKPMRRKDRRWAFRAQWMLFFVR